MSWAALCRRLDLPEADAEQQHRCPGQRPCSDCRGCRSRAAARLDRRSSDEWWTSAILPFEHPAIMAAGRARAARHANAWPEPGAHGITYRTRRGTPPGLRTRDGGRSPGSRVPACQALPSRPAPVAVPSRTLTAHSCGGSRGLGPEGRHRVPYCFLAETVVASTMRRSSAPGQLRRSRSPLSCCSLWHQGRRAGGDAAFAEQAVVGDEIGGEAAGLLDQDQAGEAVPGRAEMGDEGVAAAVGDPAELDGGRAAAAMLEALARAPRRPGDVGFALLAEAVGDGQARGVEPWRCPRPGSARRCGRRRRRAGR